MMTKRKKGYLIDGLVLFDTHARTRKHETHAQTQTFTPKMQKPAHAHSRNAANNNNTELRNKPFVKIGGIQVL